MKTIKKIGLINMLITKVTEDNYTEDLERLSKPGKEYTLVWRWWEGEGEGGGRRRGEGQAGGVRGHSRQREEGWACGTGQGRRSLIVLCKTNKTLSSKNWILFLFQALSTLCK